METAAIAVLVLDHRPDLAPPIWAHQAVSTAGNWSGWLLSLQHSLSSITPERWAPERT